MESKPSYKAWRLLRTGGDTKPVSVSGLVFDIDKTLYYHPEYHAAGTRGEISEIARILGHSYDDMKSMIAARKQDLAIRLDRQATMTETVISLGVTRKQWNDLRCQAWQPEEWLTIDPEICHMVVCLKDRYKIAFGTNAPAAVGRRVLQMIGIIAVLSEVLIFGPESFGISKPDPRFFSLIAKELGLMASQCLSIGDREEADGIPAIEAGFADALIVSGSRSALIDAASILFDNIRVEVSHG